MRALVLDGKYAEAIAAFQYYTMEASNYVGYAYHKLGDARSGMIGLADPD